MTEKKICYLIYKQIYSFAQMHLNSVSVCGLQDGGMAWGGVACGGLEV